jgi:microcystin-dependent protein
MATGFPAVPGDIMTSAMYNGLISFAVTTESGATYTVDNDDLYQVLIQTSNASTKTVTIAPDATLTAAAVGSAITFINTGAGDLTFAAGAGVTIASTGAAQPRHLLPNMQLVPQSALQPILGLLSVLCSNDR